VVVATQSRSQHRNKELALKELERRLAARRRRPKARIGTHPTRAARQRRLDEKRRAGTQKKLRRPPQEE